MLCVRSKNTTYSKASWGSFTRGANSAMSSRISAIQSSRDSTAAHARGGKIHGRSPRVLRSVLITRSSVFRGTLNDSDSSSSGAIQSARSRL